MSASLQGQDQYKSYKPSLIQLLNHIDKPTTPYTTQTQFTADRLLQITDKQVYEWLAIRAYGVPNPGAEDKPTFARSNSIQYSKKAVSYFMPNKNTQWCVALNSGNPTRSTLVNNLIKGIKKKEVRKEGKALMARRPLEIDEFRQLIKKRVASFLITSLHSQRSIDATTGTKRDLVKLA